MLLPVSYHYGTFFVGSRARVPLLVFHPLLISFIDSEMILYLTVNSMTRSSAFNRATLSNSQFHISTSDTTMPNFTAKSSLHLKRVYARFECFWTYFETNFLILNSLGHLIQERLP